VAISNKIDVNISSQDEFETWLQGKPVEWARVIASRTALRVLPLLEQAFVSDQLEKHHSLTLTSVTFLANLISWSTSKYPDHDMRSASAAAAASADAASAAFAADAAAAAFAAAASTAFAAAADATAFADAAAAAASAAAASAAAASAIWNSISADAMALQNGVIPKELASHKLWPASRPDWARTAWDSLKSQLIKLGDEWDVWIRWYRSRLAGKPSFSIPSRIIDEPVAEKIDLAIADSSDDFWEQDPAIVNSEIKRIAKEHGVHFAAPRIKDVESGADASSEIADSSASRPSSQTSTDPLEDDEEFEEEKNELNSALISDTEFIPDTHDIETDHLGRADIAFVLAKMLNQVWDSQNPDQEKPKNPFKSAWWTGLFAHHEDRKSVV